MKCTNCTHTIWKPAVSLQMMEGGKMVELTLCRKCLLKHAGNIIASLAIAGKLPEALRGE